MENSNKRPILVTGSHRSGSTWVGQMIARSPEVTYIHEPFNIDPRSGICGGRFDNWFTYVCERNASLYYEYLRNCFSFRYPLVRKIRTIRSPKNAVRVLENYGRFALDRMQRKRSLIKDPIAIFSTEWLAYTFDMDVIVLIRHPAAFAGSLKHANWTYPFQHFLNQPLLMQDHLSEYAAEIGAFATDEKDIIDQAILLWNVIYATIIVFKSQHKEWYFVRHEDIADDPIVEYRKIFQRIDLEYPQSIQNEILDFSRAKTSDEFEDTLSIRRESKATILNWRNRLTPEEIDRVKEGTRQVSSYFYDEGDW